LGFGIVGALAVALVAVVACSSQKLDEVAGGSGGPGSSSGAGGGVCSTGREGCPCSTPRQSVDCGHLVNRFGDYVTCQTGTATCQGGVWGACQGSTIYTKSLTSSTLGGGGIRVQSVTQTCNDPCDPNSCSETQHGPADVDAGGLSVTEAGITIQPTTTQTGGTGDAGRICSGLQCQVDWSCPMGSSTTLTGTVYDPAGNNPLYNAYVYIPVDPSGNLPAFSSGASCDACAGIASLDAVAVAQTDVYGHFTLTNVPTTAKAPFNQIPLVIQMGKWRRLQMLPTVPDCTSTTVPAANSRLPRNKFDGWNNTADIPRMAIATGNVDPMECMMLKMGIDPAEFQLPGSGARRIDFYQANGLGFSGGTAPPESKLATGACSTATCYQNSDCSGSNTCTGGALGSGGTAGTCSCLSNGDCKSGATCSLDPLMNYDVVLLPCEGNEDDGNDSYATNVANYVLAGGRLFTTHYGYTWLSTPTSGTANATNPKTGALNPFYPVGNWNLNNTQYGSAGATIDTNFPKGQAFEQWMDNIGAASGAAITLNSPRHDVDSVNPAYATEWMHHGSSPDETFHFTFNTPMGAGMGDAGADGGAGLCGRVVYSDFHVSGTALVQGNSCATNADCGFGNTCSGGTYGTCSAQSCKTAADCGDPKFTCTSTLGTCGCKTNADCAAMSAGTCNGAVAGKCGCFSNADCAAMGAGTCSGGQQGTCTAGNSSTCNQNSDCNTNLCVGGSVGQCVMNGQCAHNHDCASGSCNKTTGVCNSEPTCQSNNDCGSAEKCQGGSQGTCACAQNGDCGRHGACSGGTVGTCSGGSCYQGSDCPAGPQTCSGNAKAGQCTVATCSGNSSCTSGTGACTGYSSGSCTPNACTSNGNCGTPGNGQERCRGGTCSGCMTDNDCPGNNQSCQGGSTGTCQGSSNAFPGACAQGRLTPQESALEFMLLDLTACISPDSSAPPAPPGVTTTFSPVTFVETFTATCPSGTHVVWRELDWQATVPNTASIAFSARTVEPPADGGPASFTGAQSVQIAKATTSTTLPGWDGALIDATGVDGGQKGAFNTATPPVSSRADLQLTITLNPTSDMKATPTLIQWQVKSDCPPSE
jgi:hypothetical protein